MQIVVHYERLFGFYLKKSEMKILSLLYTLSLLSTAIFVYQGGILKICLRIDACLSDIDLRKRNRIVRYLLIKPLFCYNILHIWYDVYEFYVY